MKPRIEEKFWKPELEQEILEKWKEENLLVFDPDTQKPTFVIDTPPPYPSGVWHVGAAAQYAQIDMVARAARMMGFEVWFPIGFDRNGIPVEKYTERKYGIKMQDVSREEFIELCRKALDELEEEIRRVMERMGLSADFANAYHTDSPEYRALTQATFIELWKRGLIYEATRPNNYCYDCGTTIADADVEYVRLPTQLVYIKFSLEDAEGDVTIATTRPELLCSCQAVIVNPEDERYLHLHGKHAIVPIFERSVPIIPHPAARPEFGTGVVMVCSYGDFEDVRLFRELGLKEIIAIGEDGRMTEAAGSYAGLPVEEARKKIIEDLKTMGRVVKVERIMHRVPVCERSGVPIEIIPMKEYYLKQLDFKDTMEKLAKELKFYPEKHRQRLLDWIRSITIDWPITRRRYYGTEVPIWYCKKCGEPHVPEPGKYYRPWKESPPFEKCKKCGNDTFEGEFRTFDTWFDSSITPLFLSKFWKDEKFFEKVYPISIRPQGYEIIRTWLYYTMLRCYQLTGKCPFEAAWIGGLGVDEKGEKMSKSKGNVVLPMPILEKYGADAFRLWGAGEANLGEDYRFSERKVADARKFLTKLWNIARFISSFPVVEELAPEELEASDKWILAETNRLIEEVTDAYKNYNFFVAITKVKEFTWNVFASHYIELVKPRAYGREGFSEAERRSAWFSLHRVLKTILLLSAPVIPFMTDFLWRKLYSEESVHKQKFPEKLGGVEEKWLELTRELLSFNSYVWNEKKKRNLSLKDEIEIGVPESLKPLEKDLRAMHNLKG